MRTIHKYTLKSPLPFNMSLTWIEYPTFRLLSCGKQGTDDARLKLWAEVLESPASIPEDMKRRLVLVAGTGADLEKIHPAAKNFVGTIDDDGLMWHVFELTGEMKILNRVFTSYTEATSPQEVK